MRTPIRHELWDTKKHDPKTLMLSVLLSWEFMVPFFVLDALPHACMVRCGRPAVFVWLCKLHTIEDRVLCHATVISSTYLLKAEESWRLHVVLYCRVCSIYVYTVSCIF